MPVGALAETIPAYTVWFGSSGILIALTTLIIGRDQSVTEATVRTYEFRLAELNEHLWRVANLAQTIVMSRGMTYNTIRDETAFQALRKQVTRTNRALLAISRTRILTATSVASIVLHVFGGLSLVGLGLHGGSALRTDDGHVILSWGLATGIAVILLAAKAVVFLTTATTTDRQT